MKKIFKKQILQNVSDILDVDYKTTLNVVETLISEIEYETLQGNEVQLTGFWKFRIFPNKRTRYYSWFKKEYVTSDKDKIFVFSPSVKFKNKINFKKDQDNS